MGKEAERLVEMIKNIKDSSNRCRTEIEQIIFAILFVALFVCCAYLRQMPRS
jgi:hypothetical protein